MGQAIRIAFTSSSTPRRCGIATFTADLMAAIRVADPSTRCSVAAIDEPNVVRPYGPEVRWRIRQGEPATYRAAAAAINASSADVVNVQHEFGLYGVWREPGYRDGRWVETGYEDHLREFLDTIRKPVITTLHTVLPDPPPSLREAVRTIAARSDEIVVMVGTAVDVLAADYGITRTPVVIPHGMPAVEPHGRVRLKAKLGVEGRTIISTFGLVDPRKGLEYMVEAMPAVVARHPRALYLIAGQTHPELLKTQGEAYRNGLIEDVRRLGMQGHVAFVDQYMSQREIIELLLASDVYVTPYLDPNQITSGTLSYALGAGKAVVSTPYLHAAEALAGERGILVPFRDAEALAAAVDSILGNPARKQALESAAYAYAKDSAWPQAAMRFVELAGRVADAHRERRAERRSLSRAVDSGLGKRVADNPVIAPADVTPSRPGLEVVSVFNAAAAQVDGEVVLLLRVGERPRTDVDPPEGSMTFDLSGPEPRLEPLAPGMTREQLVGVAFLDTTPEPPQVIDVYLPRDLPGLDLSDPRTIRYRGSTGGFTAAADDVTDFLTQMSHLRVARSRDGVHFEVDTEPALAPADRFEEYGCEDPRATLIDGRWEVTYVSVSRLGITTSRATTTDFREFERRGVMFLPDHKDVVLFPERVAGRYVAFTRPMPASFGRVLGIWIAFSDDLDTWGNHQPLALPRWGMWDELRTGAGTVPFRVAEGWLELYHGVDRDQRYAMGALLLDACDPTRVLARSRRPILVPSEPFERAGVFNNVVFSCGHVPLDAKGERIRVYYGAADTVLGAADFVVRDIVDDLEPC
ncbi:MAG TPA: glycosyltransferase [Candidatus Angelobacter sp.]|nr:glycosyltransferase [Candidatus Angelobacter sp.]